MDRGAWQDIVFSFSASQVITILTVVWINLHWPSVLLV